MRDPRRQNVEGGMQSSMAVRQRPSGTAGAGARVAGKEPGSGTSAGGGLSLSSTASNDTGYSSIGNNNSAERTSSCWTANTTDLTKPSGAFLFT